MRNEARRHFTPEQKAQIVRRHLAGKEAVSALVEEFRKALPGCEIQWGVDGQGM